MSEIPDTQPNQALPAAGKKPAKSSNFLYAILGFLVLIALGIMGGYFNGVGIRQHAQATQVSQQIEDQFNLGNQAMSAGQYEVARQHYQYVIDHNPNYPGVQAAYTQLLLRMQISPTPVFTETPLFTPTPDLRGAQEIYNQIQSLMAAGPKTVEDWNAVLDSLDALRKNSPDFKPAEIDGYYYIALRQRGIAKIFAQPCQSISLEGGIYDLTLASNFGPLDSYANDLQTAARLYNIGASYWELDWNQVVYYFGQVTLSAPNLMDSSCLMASQRWAYASIKVGDMYAATEDYCNAATQYANAAGVNIPENATVAPTADYAYNRCNPPAPPPPPQATPTLTGETPTETTTP